MNTLFKVQSDHHSHDTSYQSLLESNISGYGLKSVKLLLVTTYKTVGLPVSIIARILLPLKAFENFYSYINITLSISKNLVFSANHSLLFNH